MATGRESREVLLGLMRGFVVSQALYAAAVLGVADHLQDGPRGAQNLAAACGCRADALERLMRALCSSGVFIEGPTGRFGLTDLGALLRSEEPSLRNWVVMNGDLVYRILGHTVDTIRSGEAASATTLGQGFFEHLSEHPDQAHTFDLAMRDMTAGSTRLVLDACDLHEANWVVDVGGGDGTLLLDLLAATPGARGTVVDRLDVVSRAEARPEVQRLGGRLRFQAGDFFESLPAGADVYLLAWILHDWDDQAAGRILSSCRQAMTATSRLLILEAVLPAGDVPHFSHYGDLVMMVLFNGRERTREQFAQLLDDSGLRLHAIHASSTPRSILEVRLASP